MTRSRPLVVLLLIGASLLPASRLSAAEPLNASCTELFKQVEASHVTRVFDKAILDTATCGAYKFLIERYEPGQCSQRGLANPKVDGITALNPEFARNLALLLVEGENALGGRFGINSALRTGGPNGGQACANPRGYSGNTNASPHAQGLAVDLVYPGGGTKHDCSSAGYKWIEANAGKRKIALYNQVHSYVSGECNHVEHTGKVTGGPGPGAPSANPTPSSPSATFSQAIRQAIGGSTQQPTQVQSVTSGQPAFSSQSPIAAFQDTPATTPSAPSISSQLGTPANGTISTTSADRLEELAFGPKPVATTSGTSSVPLVVSGANAATLTGSQNPSVSQITSTQGASSPSQTTFTSGDLSWQGETVPSVPISGVQATLITLRATLSRILAILQPFGIRNAFAGNTDEHAE